MWLIFHVNNKNITANSVEKHCIVKLNVKLQVKIKFETFYLFLELWYLLLHWTPLQMRLVLLDICTYLSNKRVI